MFVLGRSDKTVPTEITNDVYPGRSEIKYGNPTDTQHKTQKMAEVVISMTSDGGSTISI